MDGNWKYIYSSLFPCSMSVKSRLFLSWTFYGCDLGIPEESLRIGVESSWRCACTYLQVRIQLQWVGNLKLNFSDDSRCWKFTTNKVWNTPFWKKNNLILWFLLKTAMDKADIQDSYYSSNYKYDKTAKVYFSLNLNQNCERVNVQGVPKKVYW